MMQNGFHRLNVWLQADRTFDYDRYSTACIASGCAPQDSLTFAQEAGMLTCALIMYPDLPVQQAYVKFVTNIRSTAYDGEPMMQTQATGCSGCGGGKVL